jgi:hypothetical protein
VVILASQIEQPHLTHKIVNENDIEQWRENATLADSLIDWEMSCKSTLYRYATAGTTTPIAKKSPERAFNSLFVKPPPKPVCPNSIICLSNINKACIEMSAALDGMVSQFS